jgi:putative membrane protein
VTPVVTAARTLPVLALLLVANLGRLTDSGRGWVAIGIAVVVVVAICGISFLQWQRLSYWFDSDGDFRVDSGVLQQQQRRLQLSRLQSVDVVQPLIARVFGMAEVKVEVAGSGESRVTLRYLTLTNATALRAEILARAAGVRHDAGEAPETVITKVPSGVLVAAAFLSSSLLTLVVIEIAAVILVTVLAGPAALLGIALVLIIPLLTVFGFYSSNFDFTVADSPDGLRIRHGLLGVQARTVPPGRVASVDFVEPLLWRGRGWVMVRLTVAGAQGGGDDEDGSGSGYLLPVASWPVALEVVARIMPGVDLAAVKLAPVPSIVRRRSPFQWRQLGLGSDERVVVTRRGWLSRHTTVTPHARVQSVRLTRGPWEKSLGLASVHFDIVPGPVRPVARHRPAAEAASFANAEVARVHAAGRSDRSARWMHAPTDQAAAPRSDSAEDDSGR